MLCVDFYRHFGSALRVALVSLISSTSYTTTELGMEAIHLRSQNMGAGGWGVETGGSQVQGQSRVTWGPASQNRKLYQFLSSEATQFLPRIWLFAGLTPALLRRFFVPGYQVQESWGDQALKKPSPATPAAKESLLSNRANARTRAQSLKREPPPRPPETRLGSAPDSGHSGQRITAGTHHAGGRASAQSHQPGLQPSGLHPDPTSPRPPDPLASPRPPRTTSASATAAHPGGRQGAGYPRPGYRR